MFALSILRIDGQEHSFRSPQLELPIYPTM